jgi:Putative Ig domain
MSSPSAVTNTQYVLSLNQGVAMSTFNVTGSNTPTGYSASGLPTGLAINGSTGAITGTPTVAGLFPAVITATNGAGSGSQALLIAVTPSSGPYCPRVMSRLDNNPAIEAYYKAGSASEIGDLFAQVAAFGANSNGIADALLVSAAADIAAFLAANPAVMV